MSFVTFFGSLALIASFSYSKESAALILTKAFLLISELY